MQICVQREISDKKETKNKEIHEQKVEVPGAYNEK